MKEVKPVEVTKRYSVCPECNRPDGTVDHLIDQERNTYWYCKHCGARYELKFQNGKMYIGKTDERKIDTLVLLKNNSVALVVQGMSFSKAGVLEEKNDQYFYDEHTCPTNYMGEVLAVIDLENKDCDPHGIFKYVKTAPYDERFEHGVDFDDFKEILKVNDLGE